LALALTVLILAAISGCAALAEKDTKLTWQPGLVVTTTFGQVKGYESSPDTYGWKAIPFARPPKGDLRWKAPQDPESWTGVRDAAEFCERCPQYSYSGSVVGDEDCLYLNIWRPNSPQTSLPVYFWIHGGGNSIMTASSSSFDGVKLASKANMIVVTVNYRLGPMGWFAHPALRHGRDLKDDSGNYGTLDIIKALEWVRDNIRAFGGDPDRVCVAGESAGAVNVLTLLISPAASGLFHRAIAQSGGPRVATVAEGEAHVNGVIERLLVKDGQAGDREAAREMREKMSMAEIENYLRAKTPEEILKAHQMSYRPMIKFPNCFLDGAVLAKEGYEVLKDPSRYNQVPTILGANKEEAKLFMGGVFRQVSPEEYQQRALAASAAWIKRGVDEIAETITAHESQAPVYAYQFNYGAYNPDGYNAWPTDYRGTNYALRMGAAHGLEIPFFWGNLSFFTMGRILFREENRQGYEGLSEAMMKYLARFVHEGDPGSAGGVLWKPWSNAEGAPKRILLDADDTKILIEMVNQ